MILTLEVLVISMVASSLSASLGSSPNVQLNCSPLEDNENTFKIFKHCVSSSDLSETKLDDLSVKNQRKIMCLLYTKSLQDYCSVNQNLKDKDLFNFKGENQVKICEVLPRSLEKTQWGVGFFKIFNDSVTCDSLCIDDDGGIKNICSAAYYTINYVLTNSDTKKLGTDQSKNKDTKTPFESSQNEKAPGDANKEGEKSPKGQPQADDNMNPPKQEQEELQRKKITDNTSIQQTGDDQIKKTNTVGAIPKKPVDSNLKPSNEKLIVNEESTLNQEKTPQKDKSSAPVQNQMNIPNNNNNNNDASHVASPQELPKLQEVDAKKEIVGLPKKPEQMPVNSQDNIPDRANENPIDEKIDTQLDDKTKIEDIQEEKSDDYIDDKNINIDDTINVPQTIKGMSEGSKYTDDEKNTDSVNSYPMEMDDDSYFFSYFMVICIIFVLGYVVYHNKQRILALVVEGRQGKRQYRGRRPNSASYHKLDSNLEEAISSTCNKNTTNIIY